MGDWADGRARDWLEHHMTGDDDSDYASLAVLLREVEAESYRRCEKTIRALVYAGDRLIDALNEEAGGAGGSEASWAAWVDAKRNGGVW